MRWYLALPEADKRAWECHLQAGSPLVGPLLVDDDVPEVVHELAVEVEGVVPRTLDIRVEMRGLDDVDVHQVPVRVLTPQAEDGGQRNANGAADRGLKWAASSEMMPWGRCGLPSSPWTSFQCCTAS